MSDKVNTRQSNFELLRILCMISIMLFHIYTQTDAKNLMPEDGVSYFFFVITGYGGRLVCNCFVMTGAWFLCETKFKAQRIVNLWLAVFFYAVVITVICTLLNIPEANAVTFVQAALPVMGRPVWFAAEYMCMLMLSPFLNLLLKQAGHICSRLLIIFGVLIIGCATLFPIEHTTPAFSELTWFLFLYLFTAWFKKHPRSWMNKRNLCIAGAVSTYTVSVLFYVILQAFGMNSIAWYYLNHYENLLSFAASLFLFYAFKNIEIGNRKVINFAGGSAAFAVYMIHQTPCFYPTLWNGIFAVDKWIGKPGLIGYIFGMIFSIYFVSVIVEKIRELCFQKFIYSTNPYQWICGRIERFYQDNAA